MFNKGFTQSYRGTIKAIYYDYVDLFKIFIIVNLGLFILGSSTSIYMIINDVQGRTSITGMINSSGDAFDVMYPGARQYLKYNDGETTYDILNSQGYANELLTKARLGRTINFKSTISVMDTDELIQMAQNPNRETLYTPEMLEILAEEIAGRN